MVRPCCHGFCCGGCGVVQDIRNCPRCGSVFVYRGRDICPRCVADEEDQFERVRRFLRTSPDATLEEVVEATDVPPEVVLSFLRQGRLVATGGLKGLLSCQCCGAPIDDGQLCAECARKLAREVDRAASHAAPGGHGASAGGRFGADREGGPPAPTGDTRGTPEARPAPPDGQPVPVEGVVRGRMHVADLVKKRLTRDDK